jgi:hypothetical protein
MNYKVFPQHNILSQLFPYEISQLILEFSYKPPNYIFDINPLYQKFKIIQLINTTETEFDDHRDRYRNISYYKDETYYYLYKSVPISVTSTINHSPFIQKATFDTFFNIYKSEIIKDKHIRDICYDSFQLDQLYTLPNLITA